VTFLPNSKLHMPVEKFTKQHNTNI